MIVNVLSKVSRGTLDESTFSAVLENMRRDMNAENVSTAMIFQASSGLLQISFIEDDRIKRNVRKKEICRMFERLKARLELPTITVQIDTLRDFHCQPVAETVTV